MEDSINSLPRHTSSWSKGAFTLRQYQGFWHAQDLLRGALLAQRRFTAQPTDALLCSCPKTGTTWLKALAFAIVTRTKFHDSTNPLLTTMPHECIPFLEQDLDVIERNQTTSDFPLIATHLPYTSLPPSVAASDCKIFYVYRNAKDVVVSYYHFVRKAFKLPDEAEAFKEAFDEFCRGVSWYGPYWDHILGYWKASLERPDRFIFLKYEVMKRNPVGEVKRLAEFLGYPFSVEEKEAGVVENIVKLCSFENLSNLEVNKTGKHRAEDGQGGIENQLYFRKAKDGDWEKYFTEEMKERIDSLMEEKLRGTGLVLK